MTDPRIWLEDIDGDEALDWVRARNAEAEAELFGLTRFETIRTDVLAILEADDRIDVPSVHVQPDGTALVHNFWTDATNPRGLLRRTTYDDWASGAPTWETVLDIDALGRDEDESWVAHDFATRRSDRRRMLVDLSPGGTDADVTREFDLVDLRFVSEDDGGFVRPVGKGGCVWLDDDTVFVLAEVGPDSMTESGYPRQVRRWRRGTPLADAEVVFEGRRDDVSAGVSVSRVPGHEHVVHYRTPDFFTIEQWIERDGTPVRIDVPDHVFVDVHGPWMTFENRKDWTIDDTVHPAGSLLLAPIDDFLAGDATPAVVFEPTAARALAATTWTRNALVLTVMDDVRSRLEVVWPDANLDPTPVAGAPDLWTVACAAVDDERSDDLWVSGDDFVTPPSLFRVSLDDGSATLLRQGPERFDAEGIEITQHFTTSADGTRIPYFEVSRLGVDGPRPTLLGGYGGFEVPRLPNHAPAMGKAWLEAGHTYVLANIRGGGEFGPAWHQAGLRDQRPRVYEDFEAVARDLLARGVTTPQQLGCSGGSNGGLLVGNMYTRSPELWGAIVCQVPLLDMARYHLLLAGASWMAEYGNPDDPDDWGFLEGFSPYHQVDPEADHPPILLTTSTRDDRVHPGHARKMAHLLGELGKDVTYWENIEGGHGGAADAGQQAVMQALVYTFLHERLT